ncbi:ADM protein [Galemys pyrenaicus]|uniref:Pro-adrenomedullin n=1 Tax=Galemys pyrenaicus TaxID=202257 RepID=A0A8J6AUF4_GALPY|nr:ADM protein [Galemys pyrenaicus]
MTANAAPGKRVPFAALAAAAHRAQEGSAFFLQQHSFQSQSLDSDPLPQLETQGLRVATEMKLVPVALLYLGSLAFLGADTARLDVASEFRKKWNKWALSRGKRELRASSSYPTELADVKAGPAQILFRPQDVQGTSGGPQDRAKTLLGGGLTLPSLSSSSSDAARIRVKRYRQSMNKFQGLRSFGCRFGTCTVQKLAHQIYQFTDKDKDGMAPRSKISPQGYGRRRRRSLPEVGRGRTVSSRGPLARGSRASRAHQELATFFSI